MKLIINKFFIILFFTNIFSTMSFCFIAPEKLKSIQLEYEAQYSNIDIKNKFSTGNIFLTEEQVNKILDDHQQKVDPAFITPKYFKESVRFWFYIYTQFTSEFVVIHDKSNLGLIYNILDYRELKNDKINRYILFHIRNKLVSEYTIKLKKQLLKLSKKSYKKFNEEEWKLYNLIKEKESKFPKKWKERKKYFKFLSQNIRTQTGQRNQIEKGLKRAAPYFFYLTKMAEEFRIPKQLLAIPFLESSFNPKAASKVGASGIWQIMPYISRKFYPKTIGRQDYRNNVILATVGAFHLLRENKMILKSWDLAITAYNSGTKHLIKARRKFGKKKANNLPFILKNYKHRHLGFASKNFYSEFTALAYTLAYKESVFKNLNELWSHNKNDFFIYLSKCKQSINNTVKISNLPFKESEDKEHIDFSELNRGLLLRKDKKFTKGTILVSQRELAKRYYFPINKKTYLKKLPKKWARLLKNQSCSTK